MADRTTEVITEAEAIQLSINNRTAWRKAYARKGREARRLQQWNELIWGFSELGATERLLLLAIAHISFGRCDSYHVTTERIAATVTADTLAALMSVDVATIARVTKKCERAGVLQILEPPRQGARGLTYSLCRKGLRG